MHESRTYSSGFFHFSGVASHFCRVLNTFAGYGSDKAKIGGFLHPGLQAQLLRNLNHQPFV